MEKWMLYCKKADFAAISEKFSISPMLARIIRNRDINNDDEINAYLSSDLTFLWDPFLMKDLGNAALMILDAISRKSKIRIMGDYDVDGVFSSYMLKSYISSIGGFVDIDIPDRIHDGYGMNIRMAEKAASDNIDLIITCDNGISALDAIKRAKELKLNVIITDHHTIPEIIPPADCVVNPHQPDCEYPYKNLCGAGVIFKLICGLEILKNSYYNLDNGNPEQLRRLNLSLLDKDKKFKNPLLNELIGYAGFATIADIVSLTGENRIIAREGLLALHFTDNSGLNALINVRQIDKAAIDSFAVGFILGPCINSAGRLRNAGMALELLETRDALEADKLALELSNLNEERKNITEKYYKQAHSLIEAEFSADVPPNKVLVLKLEDAHESVAGIISGRIKDKYNRPTIILTDTESGVKGSGRSIEKYNIIKAISEFPELFSRFGGHAMACGFTLKDGCEKLLKEKLNASCNLSDADFVKTVWIDMKLPFEYITEDFIKELKRLEPFGVDNPKPVFGQSNIRVVSSSILGKNDNVLKCVFENDNGARMEGIVFGTDKAKMFSDDIYEAQQRGDVRVSFTFYPSINSFRGVKTPQMIIESLIVSQAV